MDAQVPHRIYVRVAVQAAALVLILGIFGVLIVIASHDRATTQKHLCAKVAALQQIIADDKRASLLTSRKFRHEHPNGTPDFTRAFIDAGIAQQVHVLARLNTPPC